MQGHHVPPHGGHLVDLLVSAERAAEIRIESRDWPSWSLSPRQVCDLELLLNGGFSPLTGFMGRADYEEVCGNMRLSDGTLWPIPVVLDLPEAVAEGLEVGAPLGLRDPEGVLLAVLHVEEVWLPDREAEAEQVFGTTDRDHPGVAYLLDECGSHCVGGRVEGVQTPLHYDFLPSRLTPSQLRRQFVRRGWRKVVAYQTREPMHREHVEIARRAARDAGANLLVHPVVGLTNPDDSSHYTRVRACQAVLQRFPRYTARLALLNLAMRGAGPREAVWHAIVRKNHGCTHFIVSRDHAGAESVSTGEPFYEPGAAQDLAGRYAREMEVEILSARELQYVPDLDEYRSVEDVPSGMRILAMSSADLLERLARGREIPSWFTFPEVAEEMKRAHPPRYRQGFTIFMTGLSGSGKSTIANALLVKFLEMGGRPVTLLDGDIVRRNLSSELGFSREHRDLNILRIGFVASEITKNGGIALCAPIAPYQTTRRQVQEMIDPLGGFVLVHVATPIEVCEQRDRKGLYAKARAGLIKGFTGVSDPYEEPMEPEVRIDTSHTTPEDAANLVILHLQRTGYVSGRENNGP